MGKVWIEFMRSQRSGPGPSFSEADQAVVGAYGDPAAEYRVLADGLGLVDRSYRGLLEVSGADRAGWLHNFTTNQVGALSPGEGNYAFACNAQGRILFDLNVLVRETVIWLDVDRRFLDVARSHFTKHTISEDVSIADRSEAFVRLGLAGAKVVPVLAELGLPQAGSMSELSSAEITFVGNRIQLIRHDFCGSLAVEMFVRAEAAVDLWRRLCDVSGPIRAIPARDDAVQIRRIEAGLPWSGHEITDEYLPAETGQFDRAVNYQKGCYLGQEVIERMRTRDVVARRLVGLEFEGDSAPPPEVELVGADGRIVGKATSVCHSLAIGGVIGLGYVKTDASAAGTKLRASWGGRSVGCVVTGLPFVEADAP
jgi:folate-binding protein YgfZ